MSTPSDSDEKKGCLDIMEVTMPKNTTTIQQKGHCRILDVGTEAMRALDSQQTDNLSTWLAVEEALKQADEVHQCKMELALKRLRQEIEKEQEYELLCQQENFETMTKKKMHEFFQKLESRLKGFDKELERDITDDLDLAVQQFDIERREAIRKATTQLKRRLRNEFALEKERKIADNLRIARARFREKSQKTVRHIEEQSKKETLAALEQLTEEHQRTLDDFKERRQILMSEIMKLEDSSFQQNLAYKELSYQYQKMLNAVRITSESLPPSMSIESADKSSTVEERTFSPRPPVTNRGVPRSPIPLPSPND